MADRNVEHLGVMAYAAHFQWIQPRQKPGDRVSASCEHTTTRVNKLVRNYSEGHALRIYILFIVVTYK